MNYIIEEVLDYLSSYDICPSKDNIQNVLNEWITNMYTHVKQDENKDIVSRIVDCENCLAEVEENSEFWSNYFQKGFLDIKPGDMILVKTGLMCIIEEHYFKVESVGFNEAYINENNPKGMFCEGKDLDFYNEELRGVADDYCADIITNDDFIRFAFVYRHIE